MSTVFGLFDRPGNVDWAIQVLEDFRVDNSHISIVAHDKHADDPVWAAGAGAITGATTGRLVGLLAGFSSLVLPGVGPVIAIGNLAVTLFINMGTTTEGLLSALIDLDFSEGDAKLYMEGVKRGGILMAVETEVENENHVKAILRGSGAVNMHSRGQMWVNENQTLLSEAENNITEKYQY